MNNKIKRIGLITTFLIVSVALLIFIMVIVGSIANLIECHELNYSAESGCMIILPFTILPIPISFIFIGILIFVNYLIAVKLELQKNIKNYIFNIFQKNRKQKIIALIIVLMLNVNIFLGEKYAHTGKNEFSNTPIMISISVFFICYLMIFYLMRATNFIIKKIKNNL
ncbi:MAG: hypothetical protein RBS77_05825 [Candidatus Moranbacteria bacterium]|jgi:hypothetical protein|nr:hypothetical protein [Candidatus Moranbacteria bacterium]